MAATQWLIPLALLLLPFGVAAVESRVSGKGNVTAVVGTVSWLVALTMIVTKLL